MATKASQKTIKIDEDAEARINLMYALCSFQEAGDTETLADMKKTYPKEYAEWEKKWYKLHPAQKTAANAKKTVTKKPATKKTAATTAAKKTGTAAAKKTTGKSKK